MPKWNFFLQKSRTAPKDSCSNQPEVKRWLFTKKKTQGVEKHLHTPLVGVTVCSPVVVQRASGPFTTGSGFATMWDAVPRQQ